MLRFPALVRGLLVGALLVGAGVALAADAKAEEPTTDCAAWDIEYQLAGTLRLTDTPYGLANGAHKVGPGTLVLRLDPKTSRVSLRSYTMSQSFGLSVTAFFSTIHISTASTTNAAPNACGSAAEGVMKDRTLQWSSKIRSIRTDGTLTCSGKLCGSHGAPASGTGRIQLGPSDMQARAFEYSSDGKTFTMPFALAAKLESPKQTSFLALTGHETKRTCVPHPTPCK